MEPSEPQPNPEPFPPVSPEPERQGGDDAPLPEQGWRSSPVFCALLAIGATGVLGCAMMWLSVGVFESYGVTVFCLSPGISSFLAVILHRWARPAPDRFVWSVTWAVVGVLAVVTSLGLLIMSRGEGLICVLMALPFAIGMALIGAGLGQVVLSFSKQSRPLPMLTLALLLYPAAQEYEVRHPAAVVPRLVHTRLAVDAPPARVWAALRRPVVYPAATGWFRAGVVYPTRTAFVRDSATGCHTLVCAYSQGLARLPILAWEPGRAITFAVPPAHMPAPMRELSPYPEIHAPHLHGYFQVDSGTFRLRPLPGGRTLLEARTVYRHSIGPQAYWQLWSDYLLDAMHRRVLATIKAKAEEGHE